MKIGEFLEEQKKKCQSRIDDIDKEIKELEKKNDESNDEKELKDIGDSIGELQAEKEEAIAELKEIEAQIAQLEAEEEEPKPNDGEGDPKPNDGEGDPQRSIPQPQYAQRSAFLQLNQVNERGETKMNVLSNEKREERAKLLLEGKKATIKNAEMRSVLVSSGKIATPTEVEGIVPNFNQVSSIVDIVKVENCEGMGSNKVAYEIAIGEADDATEGESIDESNPQYDFVTITPSSIGIMSTISNQVMKQSPLDYEGKIVDSAEKALRVKCAKVITNAIVNSTLVAKPTSLKISAIDDKTLRNIAFNYGSDETIYGDAWLFLNKKDLIAFGDVRSDTTLQAVYKITADTSNPNTGVIEDGGLKVRYCLNPNVKALADASTNEVAMFYGQGECAELDLFGDYEVKVSEDFAFDKNMLAIRGTADMGCAVIKKDGFVCVTKA